MSRRVLDELKQQIPLLEYLQTQDWHPARALSRGRWMGLCPLHTDHKPSFLVDPNKGLFYCYGCGRGGDVIRFAELYHQVNFPQAVALLRQWCGLAPLLNTVIDFYRIQLQRYNESVVYLDQRGLRSSEAIEHMRIGYAPGHCLRSWLTQLGYPLSVLQQAGLINAAGHDSYIRCIVFPLESNLYGRSIRSSPVLHRFMPGSKGGLYLWEQVRRYPEVLWWKGCSTTPCYGRPAFAMSPARCEIVSTHISLSNCAIAAGRSIWPSMPTLMVAVHVHRNRFPVVFGCKVSLPDRLRCPMAMTRTASSSTAAMLISFKNCSRGHVHEL